MIITLIVVALAGLAGLAVLRPFTVGRSGALHYDADPDEDLRRGLLRQLRDLDNDLAVGKLTEEEHGALRRPVETEAVAVLRRIDRRVGSGELATGLREIRPVPKPAPVAPRRRRLRLVVGIGAGLIVTGGAVALLTGAVTPRQAGGTITGGIGAAGAPPAAPAAPASPTPSVSAATLQEISDAQAKVKQNPKDVTGHLDLAQAYMDANEPSEAAIEYLAVDQLQPNNAAANTGLALIAFQDGNTSDAKSMVDKVLAAAPKYPEALYARGVIELMGMNQIAPAKKDLDGYLAAAPYGSHKDAVQTLLAMIAEAPAK
ncbi:MAG TPA: tetratricopeptide repeat protein [Pseudonocardiaceae bacterium]|nr:tetratricopeptide repeat protein [Pseudonocardiaceae bacterium]